MPLLLKESICVKMGYPVGYNLREDTHCVLHTRTFLVLKGINGCVSVVCFLVRELMLIFLCVSSQTKILTGECGSFCETSINATNKQMLLLTVSAKCHSHLYCVGHMPQIANDQLLVTTYQGHPHTNKQAYGKGNQRGYRSGDRDEYRFLTRDAV